MKIDNTIKQKIEEEFKSWEAIQYAGKSKAERQKAGMFFTPPVLSIKMLEKFENLDGHILDPTVGCGGLLAASIMAGANPRKCYGIELDPKIADLCRNRLSRLGVPRCNIRIGDALEDSSYEFNEALEEVPMLYFKIKILEAAKLKFTIEINVKGKVTVKEWIIDCTKDETTLREIFEKLWMIFDKSNEKNFFFCAKKFDNRIGLLNAFFHKYLNKRLEIDKERIIEIV